MEENKSAIVNALLPAIQATRHGSDVMTMLYVNDNGRETVYIKDYDGNTIPVNVSLDSGTAMIRDICAALQ